jgi:hypothetical protein
MAKTFEEKLRDFAAELEKLPNTPRRRPLVDAATHNRRVRAQLAAERMAQQQRDIPAQRLQQMMDQAQEAYLDRLRERESDDARSCHRGGGDPDWRA